MGTEPLIRFTIATLTHPTERRPEKEPTRVVKVRIKTKLLVKVRQNSPPLPCNKLLGSWGTLFLGAVKKDGTVQDIVYMIC